MGSHRTPLPSESRLSRIERALQAAKADGIDEVVEEFIERETEKIAERLRKELEETMDTVRTAHDVKSQLQKARIRFQFFQLGLEKKDAIEFDSIEHFIELYDEDTHPIWLLGVNKVIKDKGLLKREIANEMGLTSLSVISRKFSRKNGLFTKAELTQLWAIIFPAS